MYDTGVYRHIFVIFIIVIKIDVSKELSDVVAFYFSSYHNQVLLLPCSHTLLHILFFDKEHACPLIPVP